VRLTFALVLFLLLVSACTDAPEPEPGAAPAPSPSATATPKQPLTVPDLVGLPVGEAMSALTAVRLRGTQSAVRRATCAGDGIVVRQRPRAGRVVEPKRRVIVLADRLACAPPHRTTRLDADDTGLVDAFVAFARGERSAPHVSDRVRFYLGGQPVGELATGRADDRTAWRMCPPEKYYAAGTCPFDVLQVLMYSAVNDFPLGYSPAPRAGACIVTSARADLSEVQHLRRAVVSPGVRVATCAGDFLLELYYDRERLAAINLSLSEP